MSSCFTSMSDDFECKITAFLRYMQEIMLFFYVICGTIVVNCHVSTYNLEFLRVMRLELVTEFYHLFLNFHQFINNLVRITRLNVFGVRQRFDIIFHKLPIGRAFGRYRKFDSLTYKISF